MYCNRSCLWVCDSGRADSQRAQCLRLSGRSLFHFVRVIRLVLVTGLQMYYSGVSSQFLCWLLSWTKIGDRVVAAYAVIFFSLCRVNAAFYLSFCTCCNCWRSGLWLWRCWWAPIQGYFASGCPVSARLWAACGVKPQRRLEKSRRHKMWLQLRQRPSQRRHQRQVRWSRGQHQSADVQLSCRNRSFFFFCSLILNSAISMWTVT